MEEHAVHVFFNVFGLNVTDRVITEWAIMLVLIIAGLSLARRLTKVPSGLQTFSELAVDLVIKEVIESSIGGREKARRYFPFLATQFFFILFANYSGLFPGAAIIPGFTPPTSALSVPASLAIIAFVATHWAGFAEKGPKYLAHFLQPTPFLLPLNLLEEVIRPLSLAVRLFGNIFGEEMVLAVLLSLVPLFVPVPVMLLDVLLALLQAYIFTTLTAVYIGGAIGEAH